MINNSVLELHDKFQTSLPVPMVYIDDFLDNQTVMDLNIECNSIPKENWKVFTRNNSHMIECNNLELAPAATKFVTMMHSSKMLKWLEGVTGIDHLIPDPHLIGAGYSRSFKGDTLKIHSDFNWNEELQLHRVLSLILYLTPDWQKEYGGSLDFYDFDRKNIINSVDCLYNRCLIWKYHKRGFHGYETPLSCPSDQSRNSFRLFYYVSNSKHNPLDKPHRSLYWYDQETKEPYDIITKK